MAEAAKNPEFETLLDYLRRSRGFDFGAYKRGTLMRRVKKRMQTLEMEDFEDYQNYLEVHPGEFTYLFNIILINYTGFFRDASSWDFLARKVLTGLIASKKSREAIRIWNPGCASGEETYTLAMLVAEITGEKEFCERVKIYATDVDEEALVQARQGSYAEKDLGPVPPALRKKYFEKNGERFSFDANLRRSIIFGRIDLIQDAPISRLDLLVCRNTLMYFNAEIQARIVGRFHFALNDSGVLFLGKAEMLPTHSELFVPIDLRHRIFIKPNGGQQEYPYVPVLQQETRNPLAGVNLAEVAFSWSLVAQVVLDLQGKLVFANFQARSLFGIDRKDIGGAFQNLELSYRPVELRPLIDKARTELRPVSSHDISRPTNGGTQYLNVQVVPLLDEAGKLMAVGISFEDVSDLRRLREEYESVQQKLETTYEELQSTNEELETTNEELQSANEELETTNEELQSTNEEQRRMNEELRRRTDELSQASTFRESILASLIVAVIVVDDKLNILMWNNKARELWGLESKEVQGKPFLSLDIGLNVKKLAKPIRACLSGKSDYEEISVEATNRKGKSIQCRISFTPIVSGDKGVRRALLLMEEQPLGRRALGVRPGLD